ncbi:PKD domain-containing protein [Lutibacter citreus]|uniref:PKD domain-containing protein n=1 Tax=Lutibacter citreus TaxID=2138210 RepID=UPI0013004083|nr:PKD domain-containing protein [Lutibacter citreus]
MKIFNLKTRLLIMIKSALVLVLIASVSSCDPTMDSLSYDLPDANSKADLTPPAASFSAAESEDFLTWTFGNTSSSATDYTWNYGDGNSSTGVDGENTFPDEGTYTITLTATDKLGATSTFSKQIEVVEPPIPAAINPEVINGDFTDGGGSWKWPSFTGGTKDAFNGSSDGSNINYDGSDNGGKTAGAKWTNGTSSGIYRSSKSRFAGQNLTVSPGREYVLEYEYAIKNDNDGNSGAKIVGEILDGHFTDGADALASSDAGPIVRNEGTNLLGKGNFTLVRQSFTASDSGLVSIFIWAETQQDAYVDNVKVYPAD